MTPDNPRRRFLTAGASLATLPLASLLPHVAQAAAAGAKPLASFGAVQHIDAGLLSVGYVEMGPANGKPVLLLHGWPYDIHTYEEVAPQLAAAGMRVIVPYLRGYGSTRFLSPETMRNGQQAAIAQDMLALMDALGIQKATVAGCDWGARTACAMAVLWPERCAALVSVSGYLLVNRETNSKPLPPQAELSWWYQFYFATDRGRAGYEQNRDAFARLIWQQASPRWQFDDATFARSVPAFHNPDHVEIVVHNYRWRIGLAPGEARYDALEAQLAAAPRLRLPTITLEGDANGAPHLNPANYAGQFSGRYEHRQLAGDVGHNLPQEAPAAFARAVLDVSGW